MKSLLRIQLNPQKNQVASLDELQLVFSEACNALAQEVQITRNWNRVVLHHMNYRKLRDRFPGLGSQMVCNAIFAVSRISNLIFQSTDSPFSISKLGERALPLVRFSSNCPVYFDKHTMSFNEKKMSLFTMNGRINFDISLDCKVASLLNKSKIKEITLLKNKEAVYELFFLIEIDSKTKDLFDNAGSENIVKDNFESKTYIPKYILIEELQ